MSNRKTKLPDFEASMKELETLVERLERGDLPLEEALKQFERGVALTRSCQSALKEAEQKVEILLSPTDRSGAAAQDASQQDGAVESVIVSTASVTITEFEPES